MIIHDIEQLSDAWFMFRKGKVSGSTLGDVFAEGVQTSMTELKEILDSRNIPYTGKDRAFEGQPTIAKLMGVLPAEDRERIEQRVPMKAYAWQLLADRLSHPHNEEEDEDDRERGLTNEAVMLDHLNEVQDKEFFAGRLWQSSEFENHSHSPDAEYQDKDGKVVEAAEFKSPRGAGHAYTLATQQIPDKKKKLQVINAFAVNPDLQVMHFILSLIHI